MKLFSILLILISGQSFAETRVNFEGNITTDSSTLNTSSAGSKRYVEGAFSFSLYKDASIYFTAGISNLSATDPATASTTSVYNSTTPFGGFTYIFGKAQKRYLSLGAYYAPSVTASYQETGTGTEIWSGAGFMTKLSVHPEISKFIALVVSINYLSSSFSYKSGTSVSPATSYTRATIVPSAGFQFFW
jgi:hypothetical protein